MAVDIGVQIDEIMGEYVDHVKKVAKADIRAVGKECVTKLKEASTKRKKKGGTPGAYASGWKLKMQGTGGVVYNATNPGLTHLLEYGHNLRQGGRWNGAPHIKGVEQWAIEELPKRVAEDLESGV